MTDAFEDHCWKDVIGPEILEIYRPYRRETYLGQRPEECCLDRSLLSHKVNLFDLHHKYADVMHLDELKKHLERVREVA